MRPLKINYETVHFNYADRIGNLTAEAVGVVKGEKHFPVYGGNRIFKPLSKSKPFSTPLFAYAEVFWSNVINEYFVSAPLYQLLFAMVMKKRHRNTMIMGLWFQGFIMKMSSF